MNIFVSMNKIVRDIFFDNSAYEMLEKLGNVTYNESDTDLDDDELRKALADADVVVTGWGQTKITADNSGDRLKLVVHTGGSVGPIVDSTLYAKGVKVVSGNELFAYSVAEGVMAYILCELRRLPLYSGSLAKGEWTPNGSLMTRSLKGKSVGIVSLGKISSYLLELLKPFNAKIKVYSTNPSKEKSDLYGFEYADLEDIFSSCDIVSIHTAANDETYHMIGEKLFSLLKDGSIFINTARGSVIDEDALICELKKGRFTAVLDVYNQEPPEAESELFKLSNVTLYPHMAGPASDLKCYITHEMIGEISSFTEGREFKYEIPEAVFMGMTQTR